MDPSLIHSRDNPASAEEGQASVLGANLPNQIVARQLNLELPDGRITIMDPCRFFSDAHATTAERPPTDPDPNMGLLSARATPGTWEGEGLFARGPFEGFDGGCTYISLSAKDSAAHTSQKAGHVLVDSCCLFIGDGDKLRALAKDLDWQQAMDIIFLPALRIFSGEDEVRAKLNCRPGVVAARDKESTKRANLLLEMQVAQLAEVERPVALIPELGLIVRPQVGDGNYPITLSLGPQAEIVGVSIDLWPRVDEMQD